jgi:asparagine synthetase A
MADVLPTLHAGLDALREVQAGVVSPAVRARAGDLEDRLAQAIRNLGLTNIDLDDETAETVRAHTDWMRRALAVAEFQTGFDHAAALIGALPGPPQSGQKPPWER